MTFSFIILGILGKKIGFRGRHIVEKTLIGPEKPVDVKDILKTIVIFTLTIESIGAFFLWLAWIPEMGIKQSVYYAIFHSISAFCNAGFSLFTNSLEGYSTHITLNIIVMLLIFLGGIGFIVVYEVLELFRKNTKLSLHSKIVLSAYCVLYLIGSILFYISEKELLKENNILEKIVISIFQSVTTRTAGFNTVEIGALSPTTLFVLILLMAIGGAPGSTAGGLKVTTFTVLIAASLTRIRGHRNVNIFYRTLPREVVYEAVMLSIIGFLLATSATVVFMLNAGTREHSFFIQGFFEVVSALGTVGLSTGITPFLSDSNKLLIAALMFIGRLGPLTLAGALALKQDFDIRYAKEPVIIG